jgi:hypothetical protein
MHLCAQAKQRSAQRQMIEDARTTSADQADQREQDAEQELQDRPGHGQQAQVGQKSENDEGLEHSRENLPCGRGTWS